jgi:Lar family restriction alleviation protein
MDKLLGCPFCGGTNIKLRQYSGVMLYYAYECDDCYCGTGHEESEAEAVAAWNKRPGGWVPVGERLPELGAMCLVWAGDNIDLMVYGADPDDSNATEHRGIFYYLDDSVWHPYMYVTHWRELPSAPGV